MAQLPYMQYVYKWKKYYLHELVAMTWMVRTSLYQRILKHWADKAIDDFKNRYWKRYEYNWIAYTMREISELLWLSKTITYKMLKKWEIKKLY
jgi:hypothetical protein